MAVSNNSYYVSKDIGNVSASSSLSWITVLSQLLEQPDKANLMCHVAKLCTAAANPVPCSQLFSHSSRTQPVLHQFMVLVILICPKALQTASGANTKTEIPPGHAQRHCPAEREGSVLASFRLGIFLVGVPFPCVCFSTHQDAPLATPDSWFWRHSSCLLHCFVVPAEISKESWNTAKMLPLPSLTSPVPLPPRRDGFESAGNVTSWGTEEQNWGTQACCCQHPPPSTEGSGWQTHHGQPSDLREQSTESFTSCQSLKQQGNRKDTERSILAQLKE